MKKVSMIAAAVAATLSAGSIAAPVEFNGYFRAGTGISGEGSSDLGYNKNGIGRLGNENDNYYEFGIAKELKSGEQTWRVESMIAQGADGAQGWEEKGVNVAQFAVKAKGVFAFDRDATLWAGKTYYQRKDIHITDFYFLNTSGTGGGIENISVGDKKLSLALIQDGESTDASRYIADVRLANIGLWDDASLELAAAYNFATEKDGGNAGDNGLLASAIVHQGLDNGFNQTVLQVGTAGYGQQVANFWGSGAYYGADDDGMGFRIINWGVMGFGDWELGHQLAFMMGTDIQGDGEPSQISAVVRPMYKWDDTARTIFELGYNGGERADESDFADAKFTVAQAWAMGDSFWARPEIRVYGSYIASMEDEAVSEGQDSDFVVGVQVEAWW